MRFFFVITCLNVFNEWPKTTLLPGWPRDARRSVAPGRRRASCKDFYLEAGFKTRFQPSSSTKDYSLRSSLAPSSRREGKFHYSSPAWAGGACVPSPTYHKQHFPASWMFPRLRREPHTRSIRATTLHWKPLSFCLSRTAPLHGNVPGCSLNCPLHAVVLLGAEGQLPCLHQGGATWSPAQECPRALFSGWSWIFPTGHSTKGEVFFHKKLYILVWTLLTRTVSKFFAFSAHLLWPTWHSSLHTWILLRLMWIWKGFLPKVFGCGAAGKIKETFLRRGLR